VQYLTNNTFSDLQRPIHLFKHFFNAANLVYVCPRNIAFELMKEDGRNFEENNYKFYSKEAELIGNRVLELCYKNNDSYINLQIDGDMEKFSESEKWIGKTGVVTVFRVENPIDNSKCELLFPKKDSKRIKKKLSKK